MDDNQEECDEEPAPKKRFVDKKSVSLAKGTIGPVVVATASTSSSDSLLQTKKRAEEDVHVEDSSSSLALDTSSLAQLKPNFADKPAEKMKIESSLDHIVDRQRTTLAGQVLKAHKEGLAPPGRFIGPIDVVAALTHLLHRAPFPLTSFC